MGWGLIDGDGVNRNRMIILTFVGGFEDKEGGHMCCTAN